LAALTTSIDLPSPKLRTLNTSKNAQQWATPLNQQVNPRSSSHSSNNGGKNLVGSQTFSPRSDLEAQVAASASPVLLADEARSWLEKKGWMLASKPYMKSKLSKVLFLAALLFKLPAEADTAIRSVAYLIQEQSEDEIAAQLLDKLLDRFTNSLSAPISKLMDSVSSTKSFLNATSQKQVAELLSLQESVKQQIDTKNKSNRQSFS
jgi:hypothetical protein